MLLSSSESQNTSPNFIKCGAFLIPIDSVIEVDVFYVDQGFVTVKTKKATYLISGFDAIEAVMLLKPSALEGKRMIWQRNAWAFHNFIGHPVVQILAWVGLKKQAIRFHDWTTPKPTGFKNKSKYTPK